MSFGEFLSRRDAAGRSATWFPSEVIVQGRFYRTALLRFPRPNVVKQYRERVPGGSRHLLVFANGVFEIHIDRHNPDAGPVRALLHFWHDVLEF